MRQSERRGAAYHIEEEILSPTLSVCTDNASDISKPQRALLEQIYLCCRALSGGSLLHIILAAFILFLMRGDAQFDALFLWASSLSGLALIRSAICYWYSLRPEPDLQLGRFILIGSGLVVGCVWAALPIFFFLEATAQHQVLITFVIGGMGLGALVVSGYYLPSFYVLFIPSFAPVIVVHALVGGTQYLSMAAMLLVFSSAVLILGSAFGRTLRNMLRLQVVRDALVKQLRDSRETLETALKSRRDSFAIFDDEDRLSLWNERFADRIEPISGTLKRGITFDALIRRAAQARGAKPGEEEKSLWYQRRMRHHLNPGPPLEEKIDDDWFLVQEVKTPAGHTVIIHTDISDLKSRELALRDSEAAKAGIVSAALDGIITIDEKGYVLEFNNAASRILNWPANEVIGRPITQTLLPSIYREAFEAELFRFLKTNKSTLVGRRTELIASRKGGEQFTAELSIVHVETQSGHLFTGFLRDISDRIETEKRLRAARDKAEKASRAKSDFLTTISHEIRTPMNGVLGAIELLMDEADSPQQKKLLETAQDAGEGLRILIDDLLDYARIEEGKLELASDSFSVQDLLESSVNIFQNQAQSKGIALLLQISDQIPDILAGDAARIRQILLNLISNAVKFTEKGKVSIRAESVARGDGHVIVRFSIKDTGIGIPASFHDKIFSKFSQVDPASSRSIGGSGLGLAIVKGLTELMGGSVNFESKKGQGSLFWCDIPLLESKEKLPRKDKAHKAPDLAGAKILVVDDSAANRLIVGEVLRRAGAQIVEANNGEEAVKAVDEEPFDLVLMDISMPEVDGITAFKLIRFSGHDTLPIVALTAQAGQEARTQFSELGFDGFLPKPVYRADLLRTASALINGEIAPMTSGQDDHLTTDEANRSLKFDKKAPKKVEAEVGPQVLAQLLDTFLEELDERRGAIKKGLENSDFESIKLNAHALKSAASTFGANQLSEEAKALEMAAARGRDKILQTKVNSFEKALEEALPYLKSIRSDVDEKQASQRS